MESILQEIFKDVVLEKNELKEISRSSKKMVLKRGDFLLRPGEEVKDIFYIHDGCLRTFFLDNEGKEHTLQFAIKGWWISDYIALFNESSKGAVSYIECIKNATLVKISKKDFDNICLEIPRVSQFHIKKLESAFASFHRQLLGNLNLSAKDRYIQFVKNYPEIEQNVKNYHIASFLGITSESLSRIRKEIST